MTRDDAKDLTLSILVVVVLLLAADCVWLHVKSADQATSLAKDSALIAQQETRLSSLAEKVELHVNPPPGPTFTERTKAAYDKTKDAVKRGYDKVKESFTKKPTQEPGK